MGLTDRDGESAEGVGARVVVIGGGFAGLTAAKVLAGTEAEVTLLDRTNHHVFQPLLYQVATAVLNAGDIARPLRHEMRAHNTTVLLSQVRRVDVERKVVVGAENEFPYDYLIVAAGASHSYFGHDDWAAHAPGLKVLEDAQEIRRRMLLAFELAERESDPALRQQYLTFVIVGGGPTGVELAGALAEITHHTLRREFKRIDPRCARVVLIEGLPRLLTAWPESLSERARQDLTRRGVEVRTGSFVTHIDENGVRAGDFSIAARTVLWGAGVKASSLGASLGAPADKSGRVKVTPALSVPGHDEVFVVGDMAAVESEGRPVPGLAGAAIQQGEHAAQNVLRRMRGQPATSFRYRDRGAFAVIGRGAAVGVIGRKLRVNGLWAWLAWLGIHIVLLMGVRNRVSVLLSWSYAFFTRWRPMWLITGRPASGEAAVTAPRPPQPAAQSGRVTAPH